MPQIDIDEKILDKWWNDAQEQLPEDERRYSFSYIEAQRLAKEEREKEFGVIRQDEPSWWEKGLGWIGKGYEWLGKQVEKIPEVKDIKWKPVDLKLDEAYGWLYPKGIKDLPRQYGSVLQTVGETVGQGATYLARYLAPNQEDLPDWTDQPMERQALTLAQGTAAVVLAGLIGYTGIQGLSQVTKELAHGKIRTIADKFGTKFFRQIQANDPSVKTVADAQALTEVSLRHITAETVRTEPISSTLWKLSTLGKKLLKLPAGVAGETMSTPQLVSSLQAQVPAILKANQVTISDKTIAPIVEFIARKASGWPLNTAIDLINKELPFVIEQTRIGTELGITQEIVPEVSKEDKIVEQEMPKLLPELSPYGEKFEAPKPEVAPETEEKVLLSGFKAKDPKIYKGQTVADIANSKYIWEDATFLKAKHILALKNKQMLELTNEELEVLSKYVFSWGRSPLTKSAARKLDVAIMDIETDRGLHKLKPEITAIPDVKPAVAPKIAPKRGLFAKEETEATRQMDMYRQELEKLTKAGVTGREAEQAAMKIAGDKYRKVTKAQGKQLEWELGAPTLKGQKQLGLEEAAPKLEKEPPVSALSGRLVAEEVSIMRTEVEEGTAGKRVLAGEEWIGQPSTYPEWMRERKWAKKEILNAMGKKQGLLYEQVEDKAKERLEHGFTDISGREIPPDYNYLKSIGLKEEAEAAKKQIDTMDFYAGMPITPKRLSDEAIRLVSGEKPKVKIPSADKILEHLGPTPKRPRELSLDRLYTLTVDELYPLKKYTDVIKDREVLPEEDPFIIASQHRGWQGKADTFFHYQTFDANYNWVGKSLNNILEPVGENLAYFDAYLVSKAQTLRHGGEIQTGIDLADAEKAVFDLDRQFPEFEKTALEINEYQDTLLKYARDSELISDEAYTRFKELNPFYVPFYRIFDLAGSRGLLGKGMANLPSIFKEIKGSERKIILPTESIVKNTYTILDAAERNQITLSLVNLAKKYPKEYEGIISQVTRAKKTRMEADIPIEDIQAALRETGLDISPELADELLNIFRPAMNKPGENVISVIENGKRAYYKLDSDIYKSITSLDTESSNAVLRILAFPARMLRLGATTLSPEFMARNPMRDAFSAFVFSKYGFIPGLDTMRGLFSLAKKDEMYWRWKMSGAEHSMLVSLDRKYLQKNVRQLIGDKMNKVANVVKHPLESARMLSEIGETITRLGEFKLAMGGANRWYLMAEKIPENYPLKSRVLKAGKAAREVTLDFGRLGAKTKAVNQIIAFWNANVQGMDKMGRSFKNNPVKSLYKVLLGITIPSVLLYLLNKDDPRYQELPQWQKDLFWIIITEKHIWRIPKPFELGVLFGTGAERALEYMEEKDPEVFKEWGMALLRGASPGILPTAFVAPLEVAANYSFFLDRPVISSRLENLPEKLQYDAYTSESAKLIGKAFNLSPEKIEHFVRGMTGGGGVLAFETLDAMLKTAKLIETVEKPEKTLADIPLIRGFVAREPWGYSESIAEFYREYGKAEKGYNAIRLMFEQGKRDEAEKYKEKYPQYIYIKHFRKVASALGDLRKRKRQILDSDLSSSEKTKKITLIDKQMTKSAKGILDAIPKS